MIIWSAPHSYYKPKCLTSQFTCPSRTYLSASNAGRSPGTMTTSYHYIPTLIVLPTRPSHIDLLLSALVPADEIQDFRYTGILICDTELRADGTTTTGGSLVLFCVCAALSLRIFGNGPRPWPDTNSRVSCVDLFYSCAQSSLVLTIKDSTACLELSKSNDHCFHWSKHTSLSFLRSKKYLPEANDLRWN